MDIDSKNLFGLTRTTVDKLYRVFVEHNAIESVIIYGSWAKGNYRMGSDIDLTIKGSAMPFSELMEIEDQIDKLYLLTKWIYRNINH